MHKKLSLLLAGLLVVSFACQKSDPEAEAAAAAERAAHEKAALVERAGAPLFDGMGEFHLPISSEVAGTQEYFNQGMVLAFGFNHAEAIRSFRAAQTLDPNCAICFWGEALATGPNINVTSNGKAVMSPEEREAAWTAISRAIELQDGASEWERDVITAQAARYSASIEDEREPLDLAYVDAMRSLAAKYPADDTIQAIFAESLMNTMPWDYWLEEDEPKPGTVEVLQALDTVLERNPDHPLALHLYIHAVEASSTPDRAEPAADQLANLVPGSGHLVHMPAHIYWRVGRYEDAAAANIRAAAVDEEYIAQCNAQGFYPALYYPHNIHFLWAASSMQGNSQLAIESARKLSDKIRIEQIEEFPTVEFFKTIPILTLVQFARWDEVLAEPLPPAEHDYSQAIWSYARGVAFARQGDLDAARSERDRLRPLRDSVQVHFLDGVDYPASQLLLIAEELLSGEIAQAAGDTDQAIGSFEAAVTAQDALPYMEPPFWYYPTRQSLGAALLGADRATEAEAVYRKDLEQYPHNGWSMVGLIESLEAQDRADEAAEVREHLAPVWAQADVQLQTSRL